MLDFYRELRWRMVKMVRNAYGMAIPEKNRRSSLGKIDKKMKKCLNWVEIFFSSSDYRVLNYFFETNRLVISSGGQTWLTKIILKGSAGQKNQKKMGVGYKIDAPI